MSVTILDGGMGQELIRRSGKPPTPLWGTQVMLDAPEIVRAVHDDYFAAGAEIATANSYALLRDRLEPFGKGDLFEDLHRTACRLACAARAAHGSGRVAGALGPLGWSYRPDMAPPPDRAAPLYAEIAALQAPYVDLFLCETVCGTRQAEGVLAGAKTGGLPVWLAISVDDRDGTRLRSGEAVTNILPLVERHGPDRVLVNCARPEAIGQALRVLVGRGLALGAYANGFERIVDGFAAKGTTVDKLAPRHDLTPQRYADFAESWAELGVDAIGGCCEIGPAHIAALSNRVAA